jgi:hypothetical protein
VRVGTIAKRVGIPPGEDPWGWSCGFYPGSHPGECTSGTAATFDHARGGFERLGASSCQSGPRPIFKPCAMNGTGPSGSMACGPRAKN